MIFGLPLQCLFLTQGTISGSVLDFSLNTLYIRGSVGTYLVCVCSEPPACSPSAAVGTRRLPVALPAGTPGGTPH